MTKPITALARKLAQKPTRVASNPNPSSLPGGIGVVRLINADGTLTVTYNGANNVIVNPTSNYSPVVGGRVLLLILGTQLWAMDPIDAMPQFPFFKAVGFSSLGPLANASSGTIGTFFTFTLTRVTQIRMIFEGDWDSLTAAANQSLVINLTIDGATMAVAGTFTGQQIDSAAAPISRFRAVGTTTLNPGIHTASANFTVGGGGTAVTLLDTYVEVEAKG